MTSPLVTDDQILVLRQFAYGGLTTPVAIYKRTVAANDYGDSSETWALSSTTTGWLRQMNDPAIAEAMGLAGAIGIFRLELPVGTDVNPSDHVVIGGDTYTVDNTNIEDTLQIFLEAYVRKVE